MMQVGTIAEIWRYPVKSMQGEQIAAADIAIRGIPGDRGWALRDEDAGEIRGAKRMPALLMCTARYVEEPGPGNASPRIEIGLPDGGMVRSGEADAAARLSTVTGREVTLWPLLPADALDHYRSSSKKPADPLADARTQLGLEEGEPFPDFSAWPAIKGGFATPPGTYFDLAPLHVVTTASLAELRQLNPELDTDRRRFRPNLLLDTGDATGFVELDWVGRRMRAGEALIEFRLGTPRCAMSTHAQPGIAHDPKIMRTLVKETHHQLGVYAWVVEPGRVAAGDACELLD